MLGISWRCTLAICIVLSSHFAWGYEFFTLLEDKCQFSSGLVVRMSEENVVVWQLNGRFKKISREAIKNILIFNVADNPFSKVSGSRMGRSLLRKVFVGEDLKKPLLIGWPYKFVEELVFYYALKGRIYVIDMAQIKLIEKLGPKDQLKVRRPPRTPVVLSLENYLPHCTQKKVKRGKRNKKSLQPDRIISGKIKVFEFLKNLQDGFNRTGDFEERTLVYGKPFLFERRPRLGITIFDNEQESNSSFLPLYYQWSNGEDFHFQSQSVVGGKFVKWLPNINPLTVFMSEVKSHFFNATFVGNLTALAAGKKTVGFFNEGKSIDRVFTGFNYLTMMGGDWRNLSLSIGLFYPAYILDFGGEQREVLASKSSTIFRFQVIRDIFTLRLMYSPTKYLHAPAIFDKHFWGEGSALDKSLGEDSDEEKDDSNYTNNRPKWKIQRLSLKSKFIRLGFDYQITDDMSAGVDEVLLLGKYSETLNDFTNKVEFKNIHTSVYIKRTFGHYTSLKVVGNFYTHEYKYSLNGESKKTDDSNFRLGGVFELLF